MLDGLDGVMSLGKSAAGDKTMVDTLAPAIKAFKDNAEGPGKDAWDACADAAEQGMKSTIPMPARRGRGSYQGEQSIGHQDPGATSAFYLISCLRDAYTER
jgi:dihydroxyacetone kinase-like protein